MIRFKVTITTSLGSTYEYFVEAADGVSLLFKINRDLPLVLQGHESFNHLTKLVIEREECSAGGQHVGTRVDGFCDKCGKRVD